MMNIFYREHEHARLQGTASQFIFHFVFSNINRCVRLVCQSTSQQYCFFIPNQHQPPATSQSAVLFFHNKSAPAISHNQTNTATHILHFPSSYFGTLQLGFRNKARFKMFPLLSQTLIIRNFWLHRG